MMNPIMALDGSHFYAHYAICDKEPIAVTEYTCRLSTSKSVHTI